MKRLLPILLFLIPSLAFGWTKEADQKIARKGAELAPPDLRLLILKFESEFKSGLEAARSQEGGDQHRFYFDTRSGLLREQLEKEINESIAMVQRREPMPLFIERLGLISHLVADANNPLNLARDSSLEASRHDFEHYFERRMTKFPTVFYGLDPNFRLERYLDGMLRRSAKFQPLLKEEYFRFGERRSSAEFDDRSTAFGVASISYSRAVTDLANIYYFIWKEAGGDVRAAPIMEKGNLLLNGN